MRLGGYRRFSGMSACLQLREPGIAPIPPLAHAGRFPAAWLRYTWPPRDWVLCWRHRHLRSPVWPA
jgi:hypothetical protein